MDIIIVVVLVVVLEWCGAALMWPLPATGRHLAGRGGRPEALGPSCPPHVADKFSPTRWK